MKKKDMFVLKERINKYHLLSVLYSFLISLSISFVFLDVLSGGTSPSKKIFLISTSFFIVIFILSILMDLANSIISILKSRYLFSALLITGFFSVQIINQIKLPNSYFLLSDKKIEILMKPDSSNNSPDNCKGIILGIHNGYEWLFGDEIILKTSESEKTSNILSNECSAEQVYWEGKIYEEINILFQKQPKGGYAKVRFAEQVFAIDLNSQKFEEYPLTIQLEHSIIETFFVNKLSIILYFIGFSLLLLTIFGFIESFAGGSETSRKN